MKTKFVNFYMKIAESTAELSTAMRLKVGSVIVKNDSIISYGYNGTPTGWNNVCEDVVHYDTQFNPDALTQEQIREQYPFEEIELEDYEIPVYKHLRFRLKTKPEVLHSESNAIAKVAKSNESSDGATLFCTHAPCLDCAKLIHQSGINSVYYRNAYRSTDGVEFLEKSGITVQKA